MGRGNRHGVIYRDRDDYGLFLRLLKEVQNRYPYVLQAYCLMMNHFHLELTTANDPIWKTMQPVMNHYARMFNQKHGYDGHLFDSRYTSCLIEDDRYFLEVSRYTGATNRKLGSDMADSVTGGGLHGKDLSKADVSVNIWAWLKAQEMDMPVEVCCAIGDEAIGSISFEEMVEIARLYINQIGGVEKFAEWGLVR